MSYAFLKPYIVTSGVILGLSILFTIYLSIKFGKTTYGEKTKTIHVDSPIVNTKKAIISTPIKRETLYIKQVIPISSVIKKTIVDTSKKPISPPANGIISSGANAHNVAGTGNHVGVNGDVNVNINRRLTEAELSGLFLSIEKIRIDSNLKKSIHSITQVFSNAPFMAEQIVDYFKQRGYEADSFYGGVSKNTFKGIGYGITQDKIIEIQVGYFDK